MKLFTVRDLESNNLVMIAPMETIRSVFRLHQSCVSRVTQETLNGGTAEICFNNKPTPVLTSGTVKIYEFEI